MGEDLELRRNISKIIKNVSNIEITEDKYDKEFLSADIKLTPFFLVYIFFEIQEQYQIKFKETDILMGKFKTLNQVAKLLE